MKQIYLNTVWPATVGFDRMLKDLEKIMGADEQKHTFPPHNIIKLDEDQYIVELAVAGFKKSEIEVQIVDGFLVITGKKDYDTEEELKYLHKGISSRSFRKSIQLADTVEIRGAQLKDGILSIALENIIPEHKKPRVIDISDDAQFTFSQKQLLVED